MKKKIIVTASCLTLMASMAMASPLTDYSQGKVSIDLMYRNTQNNLNSGGLDAEDFYTGDFDKKYSLEPSITVGLGNKFAFEYRNINAKSDDTATNFVGVVGGGEVTAKFKTQADEFNILYKTGKNISVFAGYVSAKGDYEEPTGGWAYTASGKKNSWQIGLIGTVPIAEKFTGHGRVSAGSKLTNYEVGVSYAFAKNLEFNVDYRHFKAKDLDFDTNQNVGKHKGDVTVKGLGFGVTCKF